MTDRPDSVQPISPQPPANAPAPPTMEEKPPVPEEPLDAERRDDTAPKRREGVVSDPDLMGLPATPY